MRELLIAFSGFFCETNHIFQYKIKWLSILALEIKPNCAYVNLVVIWLRLSFVTCYFSICWLGCLLSFMGADKALD